MKKPTPEQIAEALQIFPGLISDGYRATSAATTKYNCVAWSMGDDRRWWEPGGSPYLGTVRIVDDDYWPRWAPPDNTLASMIRLYAKYGYMPCSDGVLEPKKRKLALYVFTTRKGLLVVSHVARQLETGWWASKLGDLIDVEHASLLSLAPSYGSQVFYLVGPRVRGEKF